MPITQVEAQAVTLAFYPRNLFPTCSEAGAEEAESPQPQAPARALCGVALLASWQSSAKKFA